MTSPLVVQNWTIWHYLAIMVVGAVASGINAVAGGGSLLSFPMLVGFGIRELPANATNSVALWPGSLAGAFGFHPELKRTQHYLKLLVLPTLLGSLGGAWLLVSTKEELFAFLVPILILLAALLLILQPKIKSWSLRRHGTLTAPWAWVLQLLVALYGGYFGAGMGIMMLATFALYMDATIHEMNAVKAWLGVVINFAASGLLLVQGYVLLLPGAAMALGSIVGGFVAARWSLRVDAEKLRKAIAIFGFVLAAIFAYRSWF